MLTCSSVQVLQSSQLSPSECLSVKVHLVKKQEEHFLCFFSPNAVCARVYSSWGRSATAKGVSPITIKRTSHNLLHKFFCIMFSPPNI